MFLLDTNTVIAVVNERLPQVVSRFDEELLGNVPILISAIVLYELRYGIAKSRRRERSQQVLSDFLRARLTVIAFEPDDAEQAGEIRADLARKGTPIGPYDILIAAQARRRGAVLVTANVREFARVPDLEIEDWGA